MLGSMELSVRDASIICESLTQQKWWHGAAILTICNDRFHLSLTILLPAVTFVRSLSTESSCFLLLLNMRYGCLLK